MSSKKKDDIWKDPRFAHLITNPRFKQMPTSQQKVKIDKRFKGMFDNDKFKVKFTVDKYGRQVNKTSSEDLKKYYDLSSEEENDDEEVTNSDKAEDDSEPENDNIQEPDDDTSEEEEEAIEKDAFGNVIIQSDISLPVTIKDKLKNLDIDYIRGEGLLLTDSSSDEEDTDEEDEIFIEHVWGELDRDTETTDDSSKRLAAMNMDWDRIRAVDIMVLCASFIPAGSGSIISVKIFPSDFGKERMAQEEIKGPQELTNTVETDDTQVDEEDEAYKEKLREYQLNRLRYYYAVIEFDSIQSADVVYKECDGLEYESTANRLDLRFIPDDMEFEDEPKEACTELPGSKYQPRLFFTTALQQAKVELTWDENDVDRVEIAQKLFTDKRNEIPENQLRKFVACSSSSEEEDNEEVEEKSDAGSDSDDNESHAGSTKKSGKNKIDLYKSLLLEINQKEEDKKMKQVEMEFTWGVGDDKKKSKNVVDEIAVKKSATEGLTPFEKILEKKKDKKKAKKDARKKKIKAQMNSGSEDDKDDNENGYSTDEEYSEYLNDPYFAEEFANKEFEKPKKKKKVAKKQDSDEEEEKTRAQKELELLLDDGEDEKAHFSLKKIQDQETMSSSKRKRHLKKSKKELQARSEPVDNFELNVKDNRFAAVYTAPEYNIDPTDPSFKKTKGMEVLIQEKLKRRYNDNDGSEVQQEPAKKPKTKDVSLNMLVKNIKRKVANNKK